MKKRTQIMLALLLAFLILIPAFPATAVTVMADRAKTIIRETEEPDLSVRRVLAKKVRIKGSKKMTVGEKQTLKATVTPSKASQRVKWTSSNKKIATVSSKGVVTAKKAGKVTITATAKDGSRKKGTIKITVKEPESGPGTDPLPDPGTDPGEDPDISSAKYYALLIANGKYTESNNLKGVYNDVKAMQKMLTGLCQDWNVTTVSDLTADQIRQAIKKAFSGATKNDVCLFYYSGHGVVADAAKENDDKQGALLGIDERMLLGSQLANTLNKAVKGRVIVLLDSSGSGGLVAYRKGRDGKAVPTEEETIPREFVNGMIRSFSYFDQQAVRIGELRGAKFQVITACNYRQKSAELTLKSGHKFGLFTYALCAAMGFNHETLQYEKAAPSDTNNDLKVTWAEGAVWTANYVEAVKKQYTGIEMEVCGYSHETGFVLFAR